MKKKKTKYKEKYLTCGKLAKKSPKIINRLVEIDYMLDGLYANKEIEKLKEENKALRTRLMQDGIEVSE